MRTLTDLHAAYDALERHARAYENADHSGPDVEIPLLAPAAPSGPPRRRRARVFAAAAAVATLAGGSAYLWSGARSGDNEAADGVTPVCIAALPSAWRQALQTMPSAEPTSVAETPLAVTADGHVQYWDVADGAFNVFTAAEGGGPMAIYRLTLRAGQAVARVAVDDTSIVVELSPPVTQDGKPNNVEDIVLVDQRTGEIKHLLAGAPVPRGDVSGANPGSWATLQDGVYYWLEGAGYDNAPQTLMSYDIASGTYGAVDTGQAAVYLTALGISWDGGSIPVRNLPPVHPPVDLVRQTVASDGESLAWATYDDPSTVHWADNSGASRVLTQDVMSDLTVQAVSGPYVFLTSGEGSDSDQVNGDIQVLDTRTGALVDSGIQAAMARVSRGGIVAIADESGSFGTQVLDVNDLPELTCGRG